MKTILVILIAIIITSMILPQKNNFQPLENRYALVIGISNYTNPQNNLKYASKDAEDFSEQLINYGRFKKDNVHLLLDDDATRENIRKNIEGWLTTSTDKNSLILIFFSGHGTQYYDYNGDEEDGMDEYLVTYDFDGTDFSTIISDDNFANWIQNIRSDRILIFLDCCFSGGAAKQKGFLTAGVKGSIIKNDFSKDVVSELPKEGVCLIAASKSDQVSYESDDLENGVFTHFLINAIDSGSDQDFNYILSDSELFDQVYRNTVNYSSSSFNQTQEPIRLSSLKTETDLFYLAPENPETDNGDKIRLLHYQLEEEKDFDKQRKILEELWELNPSDWEVSYHLVWQYRRVKQYDKALYHLNYMKSRNSFLSEELDDQIAEVYKESGNLDEALYWYNKSLSSVKNPTVMFQLGECYLLKYDTISALNFFNMSIKTNPYQKQSYIKLLYIYLNSNNLSLANEVLQRSYNYNSSDLEMIYWMANFKKYYEHSVTGDTLLNKFFNETNLDDKITRLRIEENGGMYISNDVRISFEQHVKNNIEWELRDYPYFADLYKLIIERCNQILSDKEISYYFNKYLLFSRLNPDYEFIGAYSKVNEQ